MKQVDSVALCLALLLFCGRGGAAEVCVSVGNLTFSVDNEYLAFPPTLKGVDYWGKNVSTIKKDLTCGDQVSDVSVNFKWPTMLPAGGTEFFSHPSAPDRITLSIKPLDTPPTDMGYLKDIYTYSATQAQKDSAKYDSEKALFGFKGTNGIEKNLYSYYWANDEHGRPWFFMMCGSVPSGEIGRCSAEYYVASMKSLMVLYFSGGLLNEWKTIVKHGTDFAESHVKQ